MPSVPNDPAPSTATRVTTVVIHRGKHWLLDFFPNLRDAGFRWSEDDASSMAASVAYYLALSLFPMMLLLTSGIGLFLRFTNTGQDAELQILATVGTYASPVVKDQIQEVLSQLRNQSLVSGPFGVIAAILAAIGVFAQIDRGFDRIFRIDPQKSSTVSGTIKRVVRHRFLAFIMLVSLGGLIMILFAANVLLTQLRSITGRTLPSMAHAFGTMEFFFAVSANALLFTLVYRVLPKRQVEWMDALRGGLLAAVIWELGRQLLGVFFIGMRYTSAYGAIGSFIAILLWCYYGISILFFGAEYVQAIQNRRISRAAFALGKSETQSLLEYKPEPEPGHTSANEPKTKPEIANGQEIEDEIRVRPRRSLAD